MPDIGIDDKKRKKAMQSRLKKLGADNPVVKQAIKKNEPKDAYEDFQIVHELVSAAYSKYAEGGSSLKESMANLGKAISKAAGKSENDEDYD